MDFETSLQKICDPMCLPPFHVDKRHFRKGGTRRDDDNRQQETAGNNNRGTFYNFVGI